jgi:hypothetical protein
MKFKNPFGDFKFVARSRKPGAYAPGFLLLVLAKW